MMRNSKGPWRYVNPGLRMYVDVTAVVRSKSGRGYLLRLLPLADGRSGAVLPALLEDPRFGIIQRSFLESVRNAGKKRNRPQPARRTMHQQHRADRQHSASWWGSFRPCSGLPSGPPLSCAGR